MTRRTGYGVVALVALVLSFLFARLTIDDAFITWRYGFNLVHHGVWNWNPTAAPRVEAYTNPSYAVLSIVPAALGFPAEAFFKLVSLVLGAALCAFLATRPLPWRQKAALLLMVVGNPTYHVHLWSGLETALFSTIVIVAFGQLYLRGGLRWHGYALLTLLALTRPEGVGFALLAASWAVVLERSRRSVVGLLAVVGLLSAYWAVRAVYFGAFWPNTFYVKTAPMNVSAALVRVASDLGLGLLVLALTLGAGVLAMHLLRRRNASVRQVDASPPERWGLEKATPLVLALAATGLCVVVYWNSELLMNYANRFEWQVVAPVLVVALLRPVGDANAPYVAAAIAVAAGTVLLDPVRGTGVVAVLAVGALAAAAAAWATRTTRATVAATVLAMAAVSYLPLSGLLHLVDYRARLGYAHGAVAAALRAHPDEVRCFSIGDAGLVPFRTDVHVIDDYGLANRKIASAAFGRQDVARCAPDVVFIAAGSPWPLAANRISGPLGMKVTAEYAQDPANGYTFLRGVLWQPGYRQQMWISPAVGRSTRAALLRAITSSERNNGKSDWAFLRDNLLDFPFLSPHHG